MSEVLKHQEAVAPKIEKKESPSEVKSGIEKWAKKISKRIWDSPKAQENITNLVWKETSKEAWKKLADILHWKEKGKESSEKVSEKFQNLETRDLLKMEVSDRLNTILKWDKIERKDLKEWKEIEFNFSVDWKKNENLYLNTSAGQVLPVEIWTVNVWWVEYQRHWYEWEFFNEKWERLLIDDWTKLTFWKSRNWEEIRKIAWKINEDYKKLTNELWIDSKKLKDWDKEKLDIIKEGLKKWLDNNNIKLILDWKFEDINKIEPLNKRKEVLKTLLDLKDEWLLDWDISWEKIDKKSLETFAEKYWISTESIWMWGWWYAEYTSQTPPNLNLSESTPEWLKKALNAAMWQLWVHENSWKADKFLHDIWHSNLNARTTPWCAAFVNWSLKQWGIEQNWSLSAKSFINEWWKWHVWFKVWDQLLWWNQSNRVSLKPLHLNKIKWYYLPYWENWEKGKQIIKRWEKGFDQNKIPDWAIVVFDRWKNTT